MSVNCVCCLVDCKLGVLDLWNFLVSIHANMKPCISYFWDEVYSWMMILFSAALINTLNSIGCHQRCRHESSSDSFDLFGLFFLCKVLWDLLWPTDDVLLCQDPHVDGPWEVPAADTLTLKANLSVPSVLLIHVCAQPKAVPDQVSIPTRSNNVKSE